ncbi:DNA-binding response regulator [Algibacter marinivivus]|uniref:DNA-binding response regulator n=1 Tax=Algibacter marinivivus TaxID=2100723 RepID=A0A2U2X6P4_9FLAO|nr:response regulator transcription factor [Algibacter marinivivus]PWH83458.1 DNA-binding response regulator [Algibacter marinivivus]
MKYKVVIIEDNIPLSHGFATSINKTENFHVVSIYETCETAIENIKKDDADIYLVDIDLPGINGVEGTKQIKSMQPNCNILMVTVHENSTMVFDALCAGATGYLTKSLSPEKLINALNETIEGGAPMSIKIAKMVVGSFQKKQSEISLSEREKEVLMMLSDGNSYSVIANKLFISKNTIKFHLKKIYAKLQVNSNVMAVQKANKENLI